MKKILQLLMVFTFMGGSFAFTQQTYFDTVSIGLGTPALLTYPGSGINWTAVSGDAFPFTQNWSFTPDVNNPATTDNVTVNLSLEVGGNKYDKNTGEILDSAMYVNRFQGVMLVFSGDKDPATSTGEVIQNADRRQFNSNEVFTFVFKTLNNTPPNQLFPAVQTGLIAIAGWTNKNVTSSYPKLTLNGEFVGYLKTNTDIGSYKYPIVSDLISENPVKIVLTQGDTLQLWGSDDTYYRLSALVLVLEATIPATGLNLSAEGGTAEITELGGSLNILGEILPVNSSVNWIQWSLENNDINATINPGGVVEAWPRNAGNGTVTVKGTIGGVSSTLQVTISGQVDVLVDSIYVKSWNDSITANGGTLRMQAEVFPDLAANKNVVWSVDDAGTGATIDSTGLLRGGANNNGNGTVIVMATAADGSGVYDTIKVHIINQVKVFVESIEITFEGDFAEILVNKGTIQLHTSVLPESASDRSITWSLENNTIGATIDQNGLLTGSGRIDGNGLVTAKAKANDGSGVFATLDVFVSGQFNVVSVPQTSLQRALSLYPNPVSGNQTMILEISDNAASIKAIRIFDITGRKVSEIKEFSGNTYRTELSINKEEGIYLIKVDTDKGSIISRAIVK